MSTNEPTLIQLTDKQDNVNATDNNVTALGRGSWELEKRITPLVVIAIIAVLMALLLPY